jgi:hypothetical protein
MLFPNSVITEARRSAFSKLSEETSMNFAKFCTCSSDMISEVNFSFQWQWKFQNIIRSFTPSVPATSAERNNPSIEII